jgi:hypothetical protein
MQAPVHGCNASYLRPLGPVRVVRTCGPSRAHSTGWERTFTTPDMNLRRRAALEGFCWVGRPHGPGLPSTSFQDKGARLRSPYPGLLICQDPCTLGSMRAAAGCVQRREGENLTGAGGTGPP